MVEIVEPNTCVRGCCRSSTIPLHLPRSSYTLTSPIARGTEGTVYAATLSGRPVAAKKPLLSTAGDLDAFHRQLQILCKLDHPAVARLVAAHAKPPDYFFFFELYEGGSMADKLHADGWSPTIGQALSIASDLAKALQYVHKLGIVHRDVKPSNILHDRNLRAHLADFGLAMHKDDIKYTTVRNWKSSGKPTGGFHKKDMVGTLIYMAPEILRKDVPTEKSDVFSFAITINELLTGVVPYTDLRTEAQAYTVLEMSYTQQQLTTAVVSEGLRPVLPNTESGIPLDLLSLIQRCWDPSPLNRPSFNDIIEEIDLLFKSSVKIDALNDIYWLPSSPRRNQYQYSTNDMLNFGENFNWFIQGEQLSKEILNAMSKTNLPSIYVDDKVHWKPVLTCGFFATCGKREQMEDTHFLLPQLCSGVHMFGIFDGHRGAAAAEFSSRALPSFLRSFLHLKSPADALVQAFIKTDAVFRTDLLLHATRQRRNQKDQHSGCTGLVSIVIGNILFVANAGDCRAILCRAGHSLPMSKDHVASCSDERERVIQGGVEVKWQVDTWRVGVPALQVTRSIGDGDLKPAVTAEPEIFEATLSPDDEFLVMASDGLWDFLSNEDVLSIIRDTVKEPSMCSKRLATEAAERGSTDNITVIVVFLRPVSTAERIY